MKPGEAGILLVETIGAVQVFAVSLVVFNIEAQSAQIHPGVCRWRQTVPIFGVPNIVAVVEAHQAVHEGERSCRHKGSEFSVITIQPQQPVAIDAKCGIQPVVVCVALSGVQYIVVRIEAKRREVC